MGAALEAQAPKATLETQLEAKYTLTTPTADNTDIVTAGSTLILQKKGFSAGAVSSKIVTQNTYKDGQIRSGAATAIRRFGGLPGLSLVPGVGSVAGTAAGAAGGSRDFVNGERLWVTKITVDRAKNGIVFDLISDSYGDAGRYKASLRFELPKGALASGDLTQVDPVIAEVIKIAPLDQNVTSAPQSPRDPIVRTKAIEVGQSKDQVEAVLGKPNKTFKVGIKEIYQYKDLSVTFVNGKMTGADDAAPAAAPVAPPPPRPAAPKEPKAGMTVAEIETMMGPPSLKFSGAGNTTTYSYKDLGIKIVFTDGKVTSID